MITQQAKLFFKASINTPYITDFQKLEQSGSTRINWLVKTKDNTYIVTYNENLRENEAFFYFSNVFHQLNLNTPKVLHIALDRKLYIQEFLGEKTLSQLIEQEKLSQNIKTLVKQTLAKLYTLQIATKGNINYKKTFEYEAYNHLPILHDLYYFKNFMVDILELPYHKSDLLKEFHTIVEKVENLSPKALMIRDFQARNIIVDDHNNISFIDYQAAMEGPMMYDVISLLYQAKARFPNGFKKEMIDYYLSFHQDKSLQTKLKQSIEWLQLMRYLQVLGAYGFRGLVQKKMHFINSIEQGIENIFQFMQHWKYATHFPELQQLILALNSENAKAKIHSMIQ